MNPCTTPGNTVTDGPADPAAAAAAVREARRRLAASRGAARALVGLGAVIAFAVPWATMGYLSEAEINAVFVAVIFLVAAAVLLPLIIARVRRSRGSPAAGRLEAETERWLSRTRTLALLAFASLIALLAIAAAMVVLQERKVSSEWLGGFDTAVILACTAAAVAGLVVRYGRLRLWEDLLMAGGVAAAGLLFAWTRDWLRLEPVAMIVAGAAFVSGVALHLRWRRWARPPSPDRTNGTGKEATP
jgi:MFS family permease